MFTQQGLLRYHEMAHEGLGRLHTHLAGLPGELLTRPLEGFGLPSISAQLTHAYNVERFWVQAAQGSALELDWERAAADMAELEQLKKEAFQATRRYLASRSAEQLNVPTEVDDCGYKASGIPGEMILHLMTHAYHHKGQAAAMCRMLGHPAPMSDMVWIELQLM
ncbi:DinB family protein [bacterium]|nr:DinB family protein [bacterium]